MEHIDPPGLMVSSDDHVIYNVPDAKGVAKVSAKPCGSSRRSVVAVGKNKNFVLVPGARYGAYKCPTCDLFVILSDVCNRDGVSMLACQRCNFRTFIGLGVAEAMDIFLNNDYKLPSGFFEQYEI